MENKYLEKIAGANYNISIPRDFSYPLAGADSLSLNKDEYTEYLNNVSSNVSKTAVRHMIPRSIIGAATGGLALSILGKPTPLGAVLATTAGAIVGAASGLDKANLDARHMALAKYLPENKYLDYITKEAGLWGSAFGAVKNFGRGAVVDAGKIGASISAIGKGIASRNMGRTWNGVKMLGSNRAVQAGAGLIGAGYLAGRSGNGQ